MRLGFRAPCFALARSQLASADQRRSSRLRFNGTLESARLSPHDHAELVVGLRRRIKHVFVIFQENHSFDNYFGTFPGAENLGTAFARKHGYTQYDFIGKRQQTVFGTVLPDILGPQHDRYVLEAKFAGGKMDQFITVEEKTHRQPTVIPTSCATVRADDDGGL